MPKFHVTTSIPASLTSTYEVVAESMEAAEEIISGMIDAELLGDRPLDESYVFDKGAKPTIIHSDLVQD